ncbi:hypothetical protein E3J85_00840 [Patescibacteria group bacterium]|nr:MAG: hypothetical protein E3J85_00840 [Patescibacteria group bacterium]
MAVEELTTEEQETFYFIGRSCAVRFLETKIRDGSLQSLGLDGFLADLKELSENFSQYMLKNFQSFDELPSGVRGQIYTGGHSLLVYFPKYWREKGTPEEALEKIRKLLVAGKLKIETEGQVA